MRREMHEVFVWLVFVDPQICESYKVGLSSYLRKNNRAFCSPARNEHIRDRAKNHWPFHSRRE